MQWANEVIEQSEQELEQAGTEDDQDIAEDFKEAQDTMQYFEDFDMIQMCSAIEACSKYPSTCRGPYKTNATRRVGKDSNLH